nr:BAG-associated GRAM protein 1-like isoform X2 [Tanacetum cinerariifolium]
ALASEDKGGLEWQHILLSPNKHSLVFETVQQAHDVPFGSYFEVHCRWSVENTTESTCNIDVKVGVHFKKWCPMQSKIKSGAIAEYKKEVELMLEVARSCINPSTVGDDTASVAPVSTTEGNA